MMDAVRIARRGGEPWAVAECPFCGAHLEAALTDPPEGSLGAVLDWFFPIYQVFHDHYTTHADEESTR